MRLFISVPIDENIQHELEFLQNQVKKTNLVYATYPNSNNLHITLNFLGNRTESYLQDIIENLEKISFEVFFVTLEKIELVKSKYHWLIWVSVKSDKLIELAQKICSYLSKFSSQPQYNFSPHITIARVKKILKNSGLLTATIKSLKIRPLVWKIDKFELVESILNSTGPIYKIIHSFKLKESN